MAIAKSRENEKFIFIFKKNGKATKNINEGITNQKIEKDKLIIFCASRVSI